MGERIVVVIRIYGDIAIFLLLCDHKDSELQSWELVIGESRSALTQGKIKGYMGQWYAESKKWENYIVAVHRTCYMELYQFSYYSMITNTLNWSKKEGK